MPELPEFAAFYEAVHGRPPLPWQERLAAEVETEGWVRPIGVPTGLGKTATIDVAVWALATQAGRPVGERTLPTRIWYVVDRRLLVDAAFDHGTELARRLHEDRQHPVLGPVGEALRTIAALGTEQGPLHVTRLRGGADLGARPPEPSQPALVFATVDMFASRWLFRGYGTSVSMRPVDAAHAGIDSLILLDEAHLSPNLFALAGPLAQCDPGDPGLLLPGARRRPILVPLTATGARTDDRFDLDARDLAHPVVAQRLGAFKPTRLVASTAKRLVADLVGAITGALGAGEDRTTVLAFVNRPATARLVVTALRDALGPQDRSVEVVLLTGRLREREADQVRSLVLDPVRGLPATRSADAVRDRSLVVVATQTLEVGADLDAEHLVTESAGVRALVQRFGRLNRLGHLHGASGTIVHPVDWAEDPVYGTEPSAVWERLVTEVGDGRIVDLGPASIAEVLGEPQDEPPRAGELLPPLLWEWVKTSTPPPGEAPVELFFGGLVADHGRVSVAWRAHIPEAGKPLVPRLKGAESVDLPRGELLEVLEGIEQFHRLGPDRATVEVIEPEQLRPGDQVLLPAGAGLYARDGWDPAARELVLDVSLLDSDLPLVPAAILALAPGADQEILGLLDRLAAGPSDEELGDGADPAMRDDAMQLVKLLRDVPPHPWLGRGEWEARLDQLDPRVLRPVDSPPVLRAKPRLRYRTARVRIDAFDELSFGLEGARAPTLREHLVTVGEAAEAIARAVGLPDEVVFAVARAAGWHDLGKADGRFQRWLDPDALADSLLAKSSASPYRREAARRASGWPRGARHEALSARLVAAYLDEHPEIANRDLIEHLVISHHGHGRPLVPVVDDPLALVTAADVDGVRVTVSGDLARVDWEQPARFRRLCERYGYWGLALLEAIVRQADHAASSAVEVEVA
jgi:CRISPR-associated endonuclease/helicase Cas3